VNVVFVEPAFPPTQRHFVRALAEVGATVIGVGERPAEWLDDELRSWMPHYHQVPTVVDPGVLSDTVRHVQGYLWVDRLEATIEAHTLARRRRGRAARSPAPRCARRGCVATSPR
jgi:hypothetical protein